MKRLYRSRQKAVIGGVCAGIADYFQVDPTIVRLAWAATILLGGTGLVAYILAWLVVPPAPEEEFAAGWPHVEPSRRETTGAEGEAPADAVPEVRPPEPPGHTRSGWSGPSTLGLILIVAGAFLLARNLMPHLYLHRYWPLAIVAIGLWLVVSAVRGER